HSHSTYDPRDLHSAPTRRSSDLEADSTSASGRVLFHYCGFILHAMRMGPWKMYFRTPRFTDPVAQICHDGPASEIHICGCTDGRSEEHTSELQSRENLVCRLLLE